MASNKSNDIPKVPSAKASSGDKPAPKPRVKKSAVATTTGETLEKAATKARKTVKKVTNAVTDTVKEIAEKVTGKKASPKKTATGTAAKPARATSKATAKPAGQLDKTAKAPVSRRTKVAALAADVTTADVQESLLDSMSSADARKALDADAPSDVKQHFFQDQNKQTDSLPESPRHLPDTYGDTKLVLLVRDPEWVYAYWEICDETRDDLRAGQVNPDQNLTLRMFKISGRDWPNEAAHYFFDIPVESGAKSWYVHLPETNESWCAELGVTDNGHNFTPICRSNMFLTPRNTISEEVDSEWMTVQESFEKITRQSAVALEAQLRGDAAATSESVLRHVQKQITGLTPGKVLSLSSGSLSSEMAGQVPSKDFWLVVNTELILYGATEPDAKLTVQGKPVKLNPDGTFTIRYALPDGEQVLDVKAVKSTGDMERSITPVVTRKTI